MLIIDTIPFVENMAAHPQSADPHLEHEGISITMPNRHQLHIHNIYIPPRSSCSAGHNASIAHLLRNNEMSLTLGMSMRITPDWIRTQTKTKEANNWPKKIDAAKYTILSENEATRLPKNRRSNSTDISLTSNYIALLSDWSVFTSLASDHLPVLITINSELSTIDGPLRIYINFKKADLARCAVACDKYLAEAGETRSFEQVEKIFRKVVNKVSCLFIPAGRNEHFQPTLPVSAKSLAEERDRKR